MFDLYNCVLNRKCVNENGLFICKGLLNIIINVYVFFYFGGVIIVIFLYCEFEIWKVFILV